MCVSEGDDGRGCLASSDALSGLHGSGNAVALIADVFSSK